MIAPILIINSAKVDQYPSDTLFAPRTMKLLPTFLSRRPSDKYVIVETGGVSLKRKLTGGDLAADGPCGQPNCELCRAELRGCGHRRAGVVYRGTCNICEQNNITATYYGESGFSGYYRTNVHKKKKLLTGIWKMHLQNIYRFIIQIMKGTQVCSTLQSYKLLVSQCQDSAQKQFLSTIVKQISK